VSVNASVNSTLENRAEIGSALVGGKHLTL
jgi:hypothetical protein